MKFIALTFSSHFDSLGGRFDFCVGCFEFDPDTLVIGRFDQPPLDIMLASGTLITVLSSFKTQGCIASGPGDLLGLSLSNFLLTVPAGICCNI